MLMMTMVRNFLRLNNKQINQLLEIGENGEGDQGGEGDGENFRVGKLLDMTFWFLYNV